MFFPEKMAEVEIIVPEGNEVAVTSVLADAGIFHQVDASYVRSETRPGSGPGDGPGTGGNWQQRASAFAAQERKLLSLMADLDVEEGTPPAMGMASIIEVETIQSTTEHLEQRVKTVISEMTDEQKHLEQLQNYCQQLEPIRHVDVPVNLLREPRYVFSMLGTIPVDHIERLETSLGSIPFMLLTLREGSPQAVVMLVGMQQHADILDRAARSAYLNPLNLPQQYQGTPSEVIQVLKEEIERMRQHLKRQESTISNLRETRKEQLQNLLWQVRMGRMLAEALARVGKLRYTYLFVGWVPTSQLDSLAQQLKAVSDQILIEVDPIVRERADHNVPVSLASSGILGAFQQLVTTYGRPRYGEIDPTVFLALTFPVLFGAMFGDVGHGLVLALFGGLLLSRQIRALHNLTGLGMIVTICGLMATAFGFLYGSVFGLEHVLPALWIRPMENILQILLVAIGAGVVLLSAGFLLSMLNALIARNWSRLFFGQRGIAGLALYWSLLGLAAGAFLPQVPVPSQVFVATAVVASLTVAFSDLLSRLLERRRPLIEEGAATYVVQAFFELFETLISLFSNSLSYVRVGAFAVAHVGLSTVVFILAEMVSPTRGIGYWIVVALGNLFIIGFEGMIVAIQTLRLEYYEFFSKFFTGGGAKYAPLATLQKARE